MAVVNTKSNLITNADATPMVRSQRALYGAPVLSSIATVEVAAADTDASVYRFCRIPSNAVIHSIQVLNDAITAGTSYDIGIYQTAANGGAVVDADVFASAVDMSSARVTPLDARFEAGDIADIEKKLYELLAITADPSREYDIAMLANTVGSAAGTISIRVVYTV